MLSTCLFANENIASTIASNILAGELNPVLRVVCYVPSNKFRRICHLRYRAQQFNLSAFCSITCNKHCVQQMLPCDFFLQHCTQQILICVYLPQHWAQRIISFGFLLPHCAANYIGSAICNRCKLFARNDCEQQLAMYVLHICAQQILSSVLFRQRSTSCHFNFATRAT